MIFHHKLLETKNILNIRTIKLIKNNFMNQTKKLKFHLLIQSKIKHLKINKYNHTKKLVNNQDKIQMHILIWKKNSHLWNYILKISIAWVAIIKKPLNFPIEIIKNIFMTGWKKKLDKMMNKTLIINKNKVFNINQMILKITY